MSQEDKQPNQKDQLIQAVKDNNLDDLNDILAQNPSPNDTGIALVWSAHLGHHEITQRLTELPDIDIDFHSNEKTPITWALQGNHFACVKILIDAGANTDVIQENLQKQHPDLFDISLSSKEWEEFIIAATKADNVEKVECALSNCTDMSSVQSALLWAAHSGSNATLERLVNVPGINLDHSPGDDKLNALGWAIDRNNPDSIRILIMAGADYSGLHTDKQKKYINIIRDFRATQPYTAVNDDIAIKYEGYASDIGELKQIFNFKKRIVTDVMGESLGTPMSFDQFRDNQSDILDAHQWMIQQKKKTPHPFKPRARNVKKR